MTKALGGDVSWNMRAVATDAFGSALGNSIVKAAVRRSEINAGKEGLSAKQLQTLEERAAKAGVGVDDLLAARGRESLYSATDSRYSATAFTQSGMVGAFDVNNVTASLEQGADNLHQFMTEGRLDTAKLAAYGTKHGVDISINERYDGDTLSSHTLIIGDKTYNIPTDRDYLLAANARAALDLQGAMPSNAVELAPYIPDESLPTSIDVPVTALAGAFTDGVITGVSNTVTGIMNYAQEQFTVAVNDGFYETDLGQWAQNTGRLGGAEFYKIATGDYASSRTAKAVEHMVGFGRYLQSNVSTEMVKRNLEYSARWTGDYFGRITNRVNAYYGSTTATQRANDYGQAGGAFGVESLLFGGVGLLSRARHLTGEVNGGPTIGMGQGTTTRTPPTDWSNTGQVWQAGGSYMDVTPGYGQANVSYTVQSSTNLRSSSVGKTASDNLFFTNKVQFSAPENGTGFDYDVYQQDIDPDLVVTLTNRRTGRTTSITNRELMEEGKAPYVMKNGRQQRIELHHSRQNAQGPLFELSDVSHRARSGAGSEALHPYKTNRGRQLNGDGFGPNVSQHPTYPVDRARFDKDRKNYWQQRFQQLIQTQGNN
jgi:hypothetical protein